MICNCSRLVLPFFAIVFVVVGQASAQDAPGGEAEVRARAHFVLAREHYAAGRFEEAALAFERSYALSRRASLLYNVYLAHRDAQHPREAREALVQFLAEADVEPGQRDRLLSVLARMEEAPDDSPADAAPADADVAPVEPAPIDAATPPDEIQTAEARRGISPAAWIVGGIGLAAAGAGIGVGVPALRLDADLNEACVPDGCPADRRDDRDRGQRLARTTDALFVIGGAAVGTAIVLAFVLDGPGEEAEEPRVSLSCGEAGCLGTFTERF